MPIPSTIEATVGTEKVRDYLLIPEHPDGPPLSKEWGPPHSVRLKVFGRLDKVELRGREAPYHEQDDGREQSNPRDRS